MTRRNDSTPIVVPVAVALSAPTAPTAPPASDDGVEMLAAMFPTYDKEILSIILADHSNNVEAAMDQLVLLTRDQLTLTSPS